jgi:ferredoxin-NADP reductase
MLVKKYHSELISILNPIEGIYTLEFKSLSGVYKYFPGQFLHLAIDRDYDGTGQWPESRCFSMRSNPSDETIKITYALKGRFTNQMEQQLHVGSEVWLKLPYGDLFTQPHDKVNTVFIAGGTGITPFLSLFTHQSFLEYINPHIYLGFRSKKYNIYKNELSFEKFHEHFLKHIDTKIYYEDTDGILDIKRIYSENSPRSDYFISGPLPMIKLFKEYLMKNGLPQNQTKTDDWE